MVTDFRRIRSVKIPSLGDMRDLVTIKRPDISTDALGGQDEAGTVSLGNFYAEVQKVSANEEFFARQVDYRITHRVTLRHSDVTRKIKRGYTVTYIDEVGERTLFVEAVRDLDNKRRWTVLDCSEDQKDRPV